jgi:ribosomal protein S18 acetylase RimI-like enzyme
MADDLARAFAVIARGDMAGTREEAARFGTRVLTPEAPLRYDSNYLLVESLPPDVGAEELAADTRGVRAILVRDEQTGERLAPGFTALGWTVGRFVVMAHRRKPERPVDTSAVVETDAEGLRPAREAIIRTYPWGTEHVARSLLDAKALIPLEKRFFAMRADGEVASYADLYLDGDAAQVEDVATAAHLRNRGYASAVVMRAVEEARRAGATFVFLVADGEDWPQELYRRLGFDAIGRYLKFTRL